LGRERLQSARGQIEKAWQAKAAHLEPHFEYTDLLGSFTLAGQIFDAQPGSEKILVIFSDMRHHTRDLDLESSSKITAWSRARINREISVADLKNAQVYALGVDGARKDFVYWSELRQFWITYFQHAGARLMTYSVLREEVFRQ
jgi:hypothetical protein